MKKNYFIVMLALVCNFAIAQIQQTSYRGAFAPAPTTMWTDAWTNFDPNNASYGTVTTVISTDITSNTTWTKDKVYELNGLITVRNNATLTIQAGTVIRSSVSSSALVITRGSKLIAIGTAAEPIVFTSKNNAGSRVRGDWGGIVLLGKARYNTNNGVNFIEGLSQNVNTEFGGGTTPIDNDNSGTLKYVRIEFAGFVFAPNNELNGLTMGAVGSGTTIDYVQVSYSNDDSFEWFGGSVNCKHLVAFNGLDDDWDVDSGYKGVIQFGLSIKDPLAADISTSEAFEVDNNAAGSDTTVAGQPYGDFTSAIFTNITCIGANQRPNGVGGFVSPNSLHDKALRLRRASQPKIFNSIFLDFKKGLVIESLSSNLAATTDKLKFKNNLIVSPAPFSSVNTTTGTTPTTAAVTAWFNASGNTTYTTNTGLLTRPYDLTNAQNYKTITNNTDTVNIDYRPASIDATTGASFTDAVFNGLIAVGDAPGVSPLDYCKGVVAPALTANMTATGVSLRWYTTATIATFTTTAPVPATTVVGTKSYWVAEVDASGTASNRAKIDVTIIAVPTVALGTITSTFTASGLVATAAVGPYVGTATEFTYTVPASTEVVVTSYYWTVPLGVNIISGQGTNTLIVNYNNVAAGLLKIGNIAVQARNAALCGGALKTLAITAVLPAAPAALKMTDALLPLPTTGIPTAVTSFAKYMGQTTPLTLTATPVAAASSYIWEIPTGVNLLLTGTPTVTTSYYTAFPFTVAVSQPSAAGNVYYKVVKSTYADGISISTARKIRVAGITGGTTFTSYDVELTNLTNEGVTINPAYPIVASTSNIITVDFAGVTSANTFSYDVVNATTGAITPTNVLRIGVKAKNGVGSSVTANATAVNPTTTSTAKLLTLKAVLPAAPSAIKVTNDAVSTTTAVTVISKFIGTTTPFTVTATASATASSYQWELPSGVNQLSGGTSNVITVNFAGVAAGTTSLYLGIKAVNGMGTSVTSTNGTLVPATSSTAKLLKLTSTVPAAITALAGQIVGVCGGSSYNYTITPSLLANSYVITAPTGSVVTSASNASNATNVLATADLTFTVAYPAGFVATLAAPKSIAVASVNGVGTSLTNKSLALSTLMPAIGVATGGTTFQRCTNQTFTIPVVLGATNYVWTVVDGAVIVSGQGTNSVEINFAVVSTLKTTNKLTVAAVNACGVSSAIKSITLATTSCPTARMSSTTKEALTVSTTEVYPNPASSDFNIDITASKAGVLEIAIYSLDGTIAVNPKSVQLQEGANTINENISSLKSGIYLVQLTNSSNSEVITKKLIKE
ncbi:T9SS type A sorting domain-containing protein [Flavobacterium sp. XS2P12]|uniref:T9SS type A sorting domain-containing protein n=1 Tax=Flavobacterium melibiosi TaxID=3398734 RepID=UPI003A87B200